MTDPVVKLYPNNRDRSEDIQRVLDASAVARLAPGTYHHTRCIYVVNKVHP